MRRSEREITELTEIEDIIQRAQVCRIALAEGKIPYIVPVHFGHKEKCLYFHCATQGKKLGILRKNSNVCFEMDIDYQTVKTPGAPCGWSAKYRSVIGFGRAFIVEKSDQKSAALNIIMQHYGGDWYDFSHKELENVAIVKIEIDNMTGKKAGY